MATKLSNFLKGIALTFVFLISPGAYGFDNSKQIPLWVAIIINLMLITVIGLGLLAIFVVITES